jgi:hypothetical protein
MSKQYNKVEKRKRRARQIKRRRLTVKAAKANKGGTAAAKS